MITLAAADTLAGVASAANQVTSTIFGMELNAGVEVYKVLDQRQLAAAAATIYTAPASTTAFIKTITVVNNDATARTAQYFRGGTAAANAITPPVSIPAGGWAVYEDGQGWTIYDGSGYARVITDVVAASNTVAGKIEIADQTEMEAGTDAAKAVTPGLQHFHPSATKAWLKAGVTGNILASYNITSLTDTGTGVLTVTIATDFSSVNYACQVSIEATATTWAVANARECHIRSATIAAGSIAVDCIDNTVTTNLVKDPTTWHLSMFGDFA